MSSLCTRTMSHSWCITSTLPSAWHIVVPRYRFVDCIYNRGWTEHYKAAVTQFSNVPQIILTTLIENALKFLFILAVYNIWKALIFDLWRHTIPVTVVKTVAQSEPSTALRKESHICPLKILHWQTSICRKVLKHQAASWWAFLMNLSVLWGWWTFPCIWPFKVLSLLLRS